MEAYTYKNKFRLLLLCSPSRLFALTFTCSVNLVLRFGRRQTAQPQTEQIKPHVIVVIVVLFLNIWFATSVFASNGSRRAGVRPLQLTPIGFSHAMDSFRIGIEHFIRCIEFTV